MGLTTLEEAVYDYYYATGEQEFARIIWAGHWKQSGCPGAWTAP